jgi:hypothetical protein
MKYFVFALFLSLSFNGIYAQEKFNLKPNQSMLMFGKGPGQDATINPFEGETCYAVIQNLGETLFSVRIQQNGKVINTIEVNEGETKKIKLLVGHELYLDAETQEMAKASVNYERI